MKIAIIFFSGTGNTLFVAEGLRDRLKSLYEVIDLIPVEKVDSYNIEDYDYLLWGFPVYFYSMPKFLKEKISGVKKPVSKVVFLFCTYALYPGNALVNSSKLFKKNGFIPVIAGGVKLPGSDGLVFMKKNSGYVTQIKSMVKNAELKIDEMADFIGKNIDTLGDGKIDRQRICLLTLLLSFLIKAIVAPFFFLIEKYLKKKFYADEKCTLCGICENNCPSGNIKIYDKKVLFSDKCYLCMRCINQCPVEAIQIGKLTIGKYRYRGPKG